MIETWHPDPEKRPSFATLKKALRGLEARAADLVLCDETSAVLTDRFAQSGTAYGTVTAPLNLRDGGATDEEDVYAYGFGLLDTTYETVPAVSAEQPRAASLAPPIKEASQSGGGVIFASTVSRQRSEAILNQAVTADPSQSVFLIRRKQGGTKADGTARERYAISIPLVDSFLHHLLEQRSDGSWALNGHRLPAAAGPDLTGVISWMKEPHPQEGWKNPLGKHIRPADMSDA
jgi:hypothetical protein